MKEILIGSALGYLAVGLVWVLFNHFSKMAVEDRATWRREKKYWKFLVVPMFVALTWPIWVWVIWKIRRMGMSGELQKIIKQVKQEHMEKEHGIMAVPPAEKPKMPPDVRFKCPVCGGSAFGSSMDENDPADGPMTRYCHGNDAGDSTRRTCPFRFTSDEDWKYFTINGRQVSAKEYEEFFKNLPPAMGMGLLSDDFETGK